MATDNSVANDFSSFAPDDPDVVQQQVTRDYDSLYSHTDAAGRRMLGTQMGLDNAVGNPMVNKARAFQDRLRSILTDSNANAPDGEDPLASSLRTARAMSTGLIDVNPQAAMQAAGQAVQLEQARTQRDYLTANTARLNQETAASQAQMELNRKLGTIVFAKQGSPDQNGLPTGLVAAATLDPNDPDYAKKALQIMNDAQKSGDQVIPMSGKDFFNSKDSTAAIRGQYVLAAAQEATRRALAAAAAKAQGGQMTGREYMMTSRIVSAADLGSAALANVVDLPIGSNTGVFGIGSSPGHSIMQSSGDALRNKLSPQDVQSYNVTVAGLQRNLSAIESAGLMPQGSLTESMNSIIFRSGDTELTTLRKLAETRQIIERGVQATLNNPRLPDSVRTEIQESLQRASQAVPFTVHDVAMLEQQQRSGKTGSISDIVKQRMQNAAPEAAGGNGPKEGDEGTSAKGKPIVFKGGKWVYR